LNRLHAKLQQLSRFASESFWHLRNIHPEMQRLKQRPSYCAGLTIAGLAPCDPGFVGALALKLPMPNRSVPTANKAEILSISVSPTGYCLLPTTGLPMTTPVPDIVVGTARGD
jgi:hypothetical protein